MNLRSNRKQARDTASRRWPRLVFALASLAMVSIAQADLLEDMVTSSDQGVGEIKLVFSVAVRYLNHFPAERGELLKIYLQQAGLDDSYSETLGYKRSPAMPLVPSFSLTYTTARRCYAAREPLCLDLQFSQPVHFRIRPGEDGRSLYIHILSDSNNPKSPEKH